ncbi:MAG: hypothetical protein K1X75_13415 [Leptospirales bacterium]|nr:hypothetical protein [Leptospirales bacterium]
MNASKLYFTLLLLLLMFMTAPISCAFRRARLPITDREQWRTLEHGNRQRRFLLHLPSGAPPADGRPLLFVLHGGGGTAEHTRTLTRGRFETLADAGGGIIVYPEGVEKGWNDGRVDVRALAHRENIDDVGFFQAMIEVLSVEFPVDRHRIYATGISNGGFMSVRLACQAPQFRGAFAVAAQLSADLAPNCHPRPALDIGIYVGMDDPLVPYRGGQVRVFGTERGVALPAEESFQFFLRSSGCSAGAPETPIPDADPEDSTTAFVRRGEGCSGGAVVELIRVVGGGHTWPGAMTYLPEMIVGRTSRDFSLSDRIWAIIQRSRTSTE